MRKRNRTNRELGSSRVGKKQQSIGVRHPDWYVLDQMKLDLLCLEKTTKSRVPVGSTEILLTGRKVSLVLRVTRRGFVEKKGWNLREVRCEHVVSSLEETRSRQDPRCYDRNEEDHSERQRRDEVD